LLRWKDGGLAGCYTNEPWVRSAWVTALCEDRHGGLWIGNSESALIHYENGEFVPFPEPVARGPIIALAQATNGCLWVGSPGGGLRRLPPGGGVVQPVTNGLLSASIRTLYLDAEGTLWIGTAGGGLSRWKDGRIVTFTALHGLGANTVSQIVEDDYGRLWLGCNRGIVRVRKSELDQLAVGKLTFLHPRAYGINDGMPAEECSSGFSPAGLKTKSGLICFSTVKGLVFLDPRQPDTKAPPPEVLFEELLINGKPQRPPLRAVGSGLAGPGLELVIPKGSRELALRYTGISLASPEKVNFRYRLEGLERDWVEAGTRRTAYYQRIPPGHFVFHVTACNADGRWNDRGVALAVVMQPSFWETPGFALGLGAMAMMCVAIALRFVDQRKLRRRLALLETRHAVERERLRISQDMHDHIGGMLTQVSQLSDLGHRETEATPPVRGRFERIGAQARAAVQALDEIIWATNPKNDNLSHFAEYVSRFTDEFFEGVPVRCWQEIPVDLPNRPLGAEARHNVFLAFREALNNVLKHSGATELWVRLLVNPAEVCLEVEDNGRGFEPDQTVSGGNGLNNMRVRLAESGGRAEFVSAPGRGTKIRFVFRAG
jgi:signal transduction histidine kinase